MSATAGVAFKAKVATFTHANPAGAASDYTATITWGDGTASTAGTVSAAAGGGFEVTGSHTYAAAGKYTTSIAINDVGGAKATATSSASVVGPPIVSNVKVSRSPKRRPRSASRSTQRRRHHLRDRLRTDHELRPEDGASGNRRNPRATVADADAHRTRTRQDLPLRRGGYQLGCAERRGRRRSVVHHRTQRPAGRDRQILERAAGTQLSATVATFTDADPKGVVSDYTASIRLGRWLGEHGRDAQRREPAEASKSRARHLRRPRPVHDHRHDRRRGRGQATATGSANVVGPPTVSNVNVLSVTETTAKIGFSIEPERRRHDLHDRVWADHELWPADSAGRHRRHPGPQSLTLTSPGSNPARPITST